MRPPSPSSRRRLVRTFGRLTAVGLTTIMVLGIAGQVIRDRSVSLAILMYLPLLPAGLTAVALDLACSGRAFPRARFALALLGAVAIVWAVLPMIGDGATSIMCGWDRRVGFARAPSSPARRVIIEGCSSALSSLARAEVGNPYSRIETGSGSELRC